MRRNRWKCEWMAVWRTGEKGSQSRSRTRMDGWWIDGFIIWWFGLKTSNIGSSFSHTISHNRKQYYNKRCTSRDRDTITLSTDHVSIIASPSGISERWCLWSHCQQSTQIMCTKFGVNFYRTAINNQTTFLLVKPQIGPLTLTIRNWKWDWEQIVCLFI